MTQKHQMYASNTLTEVFHWHCCPERDNMEVTVNLIVLWTLPCMLLHISVKGSFPTLFLRWEIWRASGLLRCFCEFIAVFRCLAGIANVWAFPGLPTSPYIQGNSKPLISLSSYSRDKIACCHLLCCPFWTDCFQQLLRGIEMLYAQG